jgi:hypothetical protein
MHILTWIVRHPALMVLVTACAQESSGPLTPPREPVGLVWGSGASGAFVEDTVPLVAFYRDSANDPIGLPRPTVSWSSSNPAVLEVISESLAVARDTGAAVFTAISQVEPAYTLDVPFQVIPRWQGRLVWARQPAPGTQPGLAVQQLPSHEVQQLPDLGYPGAGSGDPYLSSDAHFVAATGTRPTSPIAKRTIFVVDLVTGDVQTPLDPLPGNQISAAWFPLDTLLAFVTETVSGYEVFTANPDGSNVQQRTQLGQPSPPFFDVTPEGNLVLTLRSTPDGLIDLFEITVAGDTVSRLTTTPDYEETFPAVSPDGSMIAYIATKVIGHEAVDASRVWVMSRDGSNPTELLPTRMEITGLAPNFSAYPARSISPSWSPDGEYVLLSWSLDQYLTADGQAYEGGGEIYAIRLMDGLAVRLTHSPTIDGQPVFR